MSKGFIKPTRCKTCKTRDESLFYKGTRNMCKQCCAILAKINRNNKTHEERNKWYRNNAIKLRVDGARKRAKINGHRFTISIEYIESLLQKQKFKCVYSGRVFDNTNKINSFAIDRIDNKKGYTKGNVQLITTSVNFMKRNLPENEFLLIIQDINYNSHKKIKKANLYLDCI